MTLWSGGARMKKLMIFGTVNHLSHNYEMLKLTQKFDVKFCYLENNVRRWSRLSHRPEPTTWLNKDQFEWVTHYEPGKYDLAILHVSQSRSRWETVVDYNFRNVGNHLVQISV